MANLGGNIKNWDKYANINTQYFVENGIQREPIYSSSNLELKNVVKYVSEGEPLKLTSNRFVTIGNSRYARVKTSTKSGLLRITAIRKPTDNNTIEKRVIEVTNKTIKELIGRCNSNEKYGIDIIIGSYKFENIIGIEKVQNRIHGREVKSDFALINGGNQKVFFISHKSGTTPESFSQYGGISERSGSVINQHPEVQNYLNKLYDLYSDAISKSNNKKFITNPFDQNGRLKNGVYSFIEDDNLIGYSVYGPNFGRSFGIENVHMIAQGEFIFKPIKDDNGDIYYKLYFSGSQVFNPDVSKFKNKDSGYRAVLLTTYRRDRSTKIPTNKITPQVIKIIPQVRTGIYPKNYRGSAEPIDSYFP